MFERQTIALYHEPCDCGNHIRHNNGGNYHLRESVHTFSDGKGKWCVVIEHTTTREDFLKDEHDALVFNDEFREFELVPDWRARLDPPAEKDIIAEFRYGEAAIVDQEGN